MYRTSVVGTLVALICTASTAVADETSGPASGIPELKVLNRFVGSWEGSDDSGEQTSSSTSRWVLGGRFVRQDYKTRDGLEGMIMRGYDPNGQRYVMTMFDSNGTALMLTGKWKEDAKTLEMDAPLGPVTISVTMSFPDEDTEVWQFTTTDTNGNVVGQIGGRNARVKKSK